MNKGPLVGAGATAEIFRLDGGRVLKLFRPGFPPSAARNEYEKTRIINALGIPSPQAHAFVEEDGRPGIVYEEIRGRSMLRDILLPRNLRSGARQFAALHVQIHAPKPKGLPCYRQELDSAIRRAYGLSDREKEAILDRLSRLPDGDALCHGDFHPDNILLAGAEPVILDWMTAAVGDPAADVARTCLLLTLSALPQKASLPVRAYVGLARRIMNARYRAAYCALSGLTPARIDAWTVPIAAARLAEHRPDSENRALLALIRRRLRS